jgi:N-methylhydantoinase A
VCCSHEIWPQMREYERAIVSIINAYVMPPVSSYLTKLQQELRGVGVPAEPYITRSNGGIMSARRASRSTAETLLSGPASGVIGAVRVAQQAGIRNLITFDVGGTSADVAIVEDGAPQNSLSEHIADFPIMMPVVGVTCVGAGGGSIASLDAAGVLKVGPQSAGADPGPACFGKGGSQATVTDALLLCGYLNAATYAGGRLPLDRAAALRVIGQMANPLGMTPEELAEAILTVTVSGMFAELSNLTAKRGIDVREFTLVGFGGAGALLACKVADELGIQRVLVPQSPGTLCALGALSADAASDFIRSVVLRSGSDLQQLRDALQSLKDEALEWIRREAPSVSSHELSVSADMRYVGQSFEIETPLDARLVQEGDWPALADAFHAAHRRVYSHSEPGLPVEMVSLRLRISASMPKPPLAPPPQAVTGTPAPRAGSRCVLAEGRLVDVVTHDRTALAGGHLLQGPALVDQEDSTVYVPAGWRGLVHESGSLLLSREAA